MGRRHIIHDVEAAGLSRDEPHSKMFKKHLAPVSMLDDQPQESVEAVTEDIFLQPELPPVEEVQVEVAITVTVEPEKVAEIVVDAVKPEPVKPAADKKPKESKPKKEKAPKPPKDQKLKNGFKELPAPDPAGD